MAVTDLYSYLLNRKTKYSVSIVPDNGDGNSLAIFNAVSSSVPTEFTGSVSRQISGSVNDYHYFVNGMELNYESISIQQSSSYFNVFINTGSAGFSLEMDDELITWGKFE